MTTLGLADLPQEVLCKIFKRLDYMEMLRTPTRVCRAFRKALAVSRLDLTAKQIFGEPGPGRSLESLVARGERKPFLDWLRQHGCQAKEFRAALGKFEAPEASSFISTIASLLGSRLEQFEIASQYRYDQGGLQTSCLAEMVKNWDLLMFNIELPLAGPLMDEHLEALAENDPIMMSLSYPKALAQASNFFGFTRDGWRGFARLDNLSLIGGGLHHTWGLGDITLQILHLSHGSCLSLVGLRSSTTLHWLLLDHPDLQNSDAEPWVQQLQAISTLRSLDLDGPPVGQSRGISTDVAPLFHITQLEVLRIKKWKPTDHGSLLSQMPIPACPQLTELVIAGKITELQLDCAALPNLKELVLEMPIHELPASLTSLTKLTGLRIKREEAADASQVLNVTMIGQLMSLRMLALNDCIGLHIPEDEAWHALAKSPDLRTVNLSGSCPSQDHMSWLQMAEFILAIMKRTDLPPVELNLDGISWM